jgi:predicted ArsR family transcriptional regulator
MTTTNGSRLHAVEIFAALMKEPCTKEQLCERVGISDSAVRNWLHELRRSGVVRVCGFVRRAASGYPARVFCLQSKPFELPDVPYRRKDLA